MKKYKIYYRFENKDNFHSTMLLEYNVNAMSCGAACDMLNEFCESVKVQIKIVEVFEQVLYIPENIILPQDL